MLNQIARNARYALNSLRHSANEANFPAHLAIKATQIREQAKKINNEALRLYTNSPFESCYYKLLARSQKHKVTPKYVPTPAVDKSKKIHRLVEPASNWRLSMLAEPLHITEKYEPGPTETIYVRKSALNAVASPRTNHLCMPFVRLLKALKEQLKHRGKHVMNYINEKIKMSLNTIYYYKEKGLLDKEKKKQEAMFKKGKKGKEPPVKMTFFTHGNIERMIAMSMPKPQPKRPTRRSRKRKKLEEMLPNIRRLAVPNYIYKRPSQDSMIKNLFKVSPNALTYQISERVRELAHCPSWRRIKPYVYTGRVPRGALLYNITDRVNELAKPAPRAQAPAGDFKENAYSISPAALKYVATPRIIEISKPR